MTALTERQKIRRLITDEADRLDAEMGLQLIAIECEEYGFDFALALRTYVRDGVPWYVPSAEAALLNLSIEEARGRAA